jgi:hypothetical protein
MQPRWQSVIIFCVLRFNVNQSLLTSLFYLFLLWTEHARCRLRCYYAVLYLSEAQGFLCLQPWFFKIEAPSESWDLISRCWHFKNQNNGTTLRDMRKWRCQANSSDQYCRWWTHLQIKAYNTNQPTLDQDYRQWTHGYFSRQISEFHYCYFNWFENLQVAFISPCHYDCAFAIWTSSFCLML